MPYQTTMFSKLDPDVELDENVVLIDDQRWMSCIEELKTAKWIVVDTEFCSNNGPWKRKEIDYWKSIIRLVQIGLPSGLAMVFNLGGLLDNRPLQMQRHAPFLSIAKTVIENPNIPKAGMALLTEYMLFRIHFGWKMRCMRDVMLMSQVLWAGVGAKAGSFTETGFVASAIMRHDLKSICERLGIPIDKTEQLSDWAGPLQNKQINYAARDVVAPRLAWVELTKRCKEAGLMKSIEAECSAQPAFCECEYNGLPIDLEVAKQDLATWEKVRDEFFKPFREKFPGVNPSSPIQVAEVLSKDLGHEFFETKTIRGKVQKQPTTSDEVLSRFEHVPYVKALLEGRSTATCMNWLKAAVEHSFDVGTGSRIRADFRQIAGGYQEHGTADGEAGRGMGRSSASRPINTQNPSNLQPAHEAAGAVSVRRSIRPRSGRAFIVADLSQAHARIAAQWSKDPVMLRDFNAGIDYHAAMTHRLMVIDGHTLIFEEAVQALEDKKHPQHKDLKSRRQGCKSTNYAKLNLSGVKTLQTQMMTMAVPIKMSDEDCGKLIGVWNDLYKVLYGAQKRHIKKVNSYNHKFQDIGIEGEYGESRALTGRRLFLIKEWKRPQERPDGTMKSGYWSVKATDAVSSVWMMTEADVMKRAMGELVAVFDAHPEWDVRWSNMAHDEVDLDCDGKYALEVATAVQHEFHAAMRWAGIVDLPVDEKGADPAKLIKSDWAAK